MLSPFITPIKNKYRSFIFVLLCSVIELIQCSICWKQILILSNSCAALKQGKKTTKVCAVDEADEFKFHQNQVDVTNKRYV